MTALSLISCDNAFIQRIQQAFPGLRIAVYPSLPRRIARENDHFFLLDTENLPEAEISGIITRLKRRKCPLILAARPDTCAHSVLLWTQRGALTVLFKSQDSREIRAEWRRLRSHYKAVQELKEVVINEPRFADFIEMIGGLTTDNDIGRNMNHLLFTLKKTFHFDSVALYITVEKLLKKKIELGKTSTQIFPETLSSRQTARIKLYRQPIQKGPDKRRESQIPFPAGCWFTPLYTDNRFIGLIVAHQINEISANTADRMLLEAFARQASLALENARLYRDVLLAQERLVSEEKKALLGQMAISLNHEINNPLSIISMEAQLLQKHIVGREDQIDHRLSNIENNIERIRKILEKISSLELEAADIVDYLNGQQMIDLHHGN